MVLKCADTLVKTDNVGHACNIVSLATIRKKNFCRLQNKAVHMTDRGAVNPIAESKPHARESLISRKQGSPWDVASQNSLSLHSSKNSRKNTAAAAPMNESSSPSSPAASSVPTKKR